MFKVASPKVLHLVGVRWFAGENAKSQSAVTFLIIFFITSYCIQKIRGIIIIIKGPVTVMCIKNLEFLCNVERRSEKTRTADRILALVVFFGIFTMQTFTRKMFRVKIFINFFVRSKIKFQFLF